MPPGSPGLLTVWQIENLLDGARLMRLEAAYDTLVSHPLLIVFLTFRLQPLVFGDLIHHMRVELRSFRLPAPYIPLAFASLLLVQPGRDLLQVVFRNDCFRSRRSAESLFGMADIRA